MPTRRELMALLAAPVVLGLSRPALAQQWPQRPVRVLNSYAAGGNSDGVARLIAKWLSDAFGQQFIVENRTGANGAIASEAVARAAPDGYTLFIATVAQIAILPAMTKTAYDPVKDFTPISNVGTNPFVLVIHKSVPAKTLAEFIDYVRARPNQLSYGSAGVGSLMHLTMALFLKRAGLEMIHVPYKGGAPALADVIAGHIPSAFPNLSEALPYAATGNVRILAVSSGARAPQIPDVPTVAESGFSGFKTLTWNGLVAPAGTPRDIVDRIAAEVARAVKDQKFKERLAGFGVDPLGDTPEQFTAMIAADISQWGEAVKIAGVKQD